jgi:hypothetical protein
MRVEIGRSQLLQRFVDVHDVNATDLGPDEFVVPATKNDEKLPDWGFTGPWPTRSPKRPSKTVNESERPHRANRERLVDVREAFALAKREHAQLGLSPPPGRGAKNTSTSRTNPRTTSSRGYPE